ncbi:MAG TPA: carboxypeptidase-like regulatory domain-containing protein [Terriglobia bacterium]|nr:carboxypeptidase-like regulatory domain-containing protein [Terriglobia bacterium]
MRELLLAALFFLQQAPVSTNGVVSGTVLYSDGTPAGNMILRLVPVPEPGQQPRPDRMMGTGPTGVFNLSVAPGSYVIQTTTSVPTFYPGVFSEPSATPIIVTSDSTTSGLVFSLPHSASGVRVQGHVTFPEGYPIAVSSLRVSLGREFSRDMAGKTLAADGTFEFTHVMPGTYPLLITAPGAQPMNLTVSDGDITGIEMNVPPLTPVQGSVSIEGSGTRPRFSLLMEAFAEEGLMPATSPNGPYRTSVTPAANGFFSTSLPPGEYRVTVTSLPADNYIKSIVANSMEILGSSFKIEPSGPAVKLAVAVGTSSGVRVTGKVLRSETDSDTQPAEKITLNSAAGGEPSEALIAPDGSFEFPSLLPGTYFARVMVTPAVSSQPRLIVIPNRNTTDLEIPAPGTRELFGRVAVDGNGPPPRFTLFLTRDAKSVVEGRQGELPSITVSTIFNSVMAGGAAGAPVLQLDVNAMSDGSFSVRIPDGEYRVVAVPDGVPQISGIPAAYYVRSVTANSGDLMTETLRVSDQETPTLNIGFGTTAPNPWVRVSGRVRDWESSRGALKVALDSALTSPIETFIDSEGKFEFPAVLQRNSYTARLVPPDDAASAPRISVEDQDVTDVEILAPAKREVTARVMVEGNHPVPSVGLSFDAEDSSMSVVIRPEPDGTARVQLPENERRVRLTVLPLGYEVRSLTYGSTNLRRESLKLAQAAPSELRIMLAADPAFPAGSLRGRVVGLDPEKGRTQVVLHGAAAFARFEAAVNGDGSFNFPGLPQGTYIPALEGGVTTRSLTPALITVSGTELAGIELALQASGTRPPSTENPSKGATLADFGLSGRARANESAAVANLRTINTAQITYLSSSGGSYGSMEDLVKAHLLDASFLSVKAGFNYAVISKGSDYAATAVPSNSATGRYGFFALPDAVIRYSTFELLAPSQQSSRPVR